MALPAVEGFRVKLQPVNQGGRVAVLPVLDAAGAYTMSFGRPPAGSAWLVERINVIVVGSALATTARVYEGTVDSIPLDTTLSGNDAVADESSPIYVTDELLIRWTGGTPGAVPAARVQVIQYQDR